MSNVPIHTIIITYFFFLYFQWLKLLPVRQRRLSEPDYDIPRPHKPIQPPAKPDATDAIPVTRFLGPVLPPTVTDE